MNYNFQDEGIYTHHKAGNPIKTSSHSSFKVRTTKETRNWIPYFVAQWTAL